MSGSIAPSSMALLDARLSGDQKFAGSSPTGWVTFFVEIRFFYGHSLPSADSRRAVVSFWRKKVHTSG